MKWAEGNGRLSDGVLVVLLFIGLSSLYMATVSGITSSNDGSHYALLRTMVANRSFALKSFDDYAEGNDIAIVDGELFSDRPPGNAVTAVPFYLLADVLPQPEPLPSRHDAENPRLFWVMALPVLAGTGTAVLLFVLLRQLAISPAAAFLTVFFFATGTTHWKYSTVFFSHALSSFLVMLAVVMAVWLGKRPYRHWGWYALLGLALGWSVVVEYSNGLLVVIVSAFALFTLNPFNWRRAWRTMLPLVIAGFIPAAFLAFYNWSNFGSPFTLSYAFARNYPWAANFSTTFSYPLSDGLRALLWWGKGDGWCGGDCWNQGIFLLSPVLLLALLGLWSYGRRFPRHFVLTMGIFGVYVLLFARHRTMHGFTHDGRYLMPYLGLLALPLGFVVDGVVLNGKRPFLQTAALVTTFGLYFLSLRNMALHIATSFNYHFDAAQLQPFVAHPANWHYLLHTLFPNVANLPYWWAVTAVFLLLALIVYRLLGTQLRRYS